MKQFLFFLIIFNFRFVHCQTYTWAMTDNTLYKSVGRALAFDNTGNLFVAETYTQTGARKGVRIVKYDVNHNFLWTQKIENNFLDGFALATDNAGNICYTSAYGDSLFINNTYYGYSNGYNMLLLKFNAQGILQFKTGSTGQGAGGAGISTDALGNIYVGGGIYGDPYFDGILISSTFVKKFVAKYNANGVLQWIRSTAHGSCGGGGKLGFKTDPYGNTYISGQIGDPVYFGTFTVSPVGDSDVFLAKIDSAGNWLWVKTAGGIYEERLYGLALDQQGNPYITGFFGSPQATFGTYTLTNPGPGDNYYVAKYDSNGNVIWVTGGGGSNTAWGLGICVDGQGTVFMASNAAYFYMFDNNGQLIGTENKNIDNYAMEADNTGCVYITGSIGYPVTFGSYSLTTSNPVQMYITRVCNPVVTNTQPAPIKEQSELSVFPNPTSHLLTLTGSESLQNVQLRIISSIGKIVYTEFIKESSENWSKEINTSQLAKGLYVIELINPNNKDIIRAKKLIIQ